MSEGVKDTDGIRDGPGLSGPGFALRAMPWQAQWRWSEGGGRSPVLPGQSRGGWLVGDEARLRPAGYAVAGFVRNRVIQKPGLPGRSTKRSFGRSLVEPKGIEPSTSRVRF